MKGFSAFKIIKYTCMTICLISISSLSLASNMSQFSNDRPVYLIDECTRSIPGYSHHYNNNNNLNIMLLTKYYPTMPTAVTIKLCTTTTTNWIQYDSNGSSWLYVSGNSTANCITSNYYCFFRNNNY